MFNLQKRWRKRNIGFRIQWVFMVETVRNWRFHSIESICSCWWFLRNFNRITYGLTKLIDWFWFKVILQSRLERNKLIYVCIKNISTQNDRKWVKQRSILHQCHEMFEISKTRLSCTLLLRWFCQCCKTIFEKSVSTWHSGI